MSIRMHKNPYIRHRKTQDRVRKKAGQSSHRRLQTCNRAQLARELLQMLNFI